MDIRERHAKKAGSTRRIMTSGARSLSFCLTAEEKGQRDEGIGTWASGGGSRVHKEGRHHKTPRERRRKDLEIRMWKESFMATFIWPRERVGKSARRSRRRKEKEERKAQHPPHFRRRGCWPTGSSPRTSPRPRRTRPPGPLAPPPRGRPHRRPGRRQKGNNSSFSINRPSCVLHSPFIHAELLWTPLLGVVRRTAGLGGAEGEGQSTIIQ